MPRFIATWTTKAQIAPTVYEITLQTTDPLAAYIPGQYVNIDFGQRQYRSYSIVNLVRTDDVTTITLIVDILPNGLASTYFTTNTPPQDLACIGLIGRFILSPTPRKKVFIATNTGLAPIIAMVAQLNPAEVEIIFGVKSSEYNYLSTYITDDIPSTACISQEKGVNGVFEGRVTDYYKLHATDFTDCDFYLCGNPNMVHEMQDLLEANNIPKEHIFTEKFLLKP
jgi:all-trans-retinol 13,14-reductase